MSIADRELQNLARSYKGLTNEMKVDLALATQPDKDTGLWKYLAHSYVQ